MKFAKLIAPFVQAHQENVSDRRARVLTAVALGLILAMGAYFRFAGLDWDSGHHLQPDERFVTIVATDTSLPTSLGQYFDSGSSPLNPANRNHQSYPYGTSFLFLAKFLAGPTGMEGYDRVYLLGRALSALADLGTVALVFFLGRRLYGRWAGLLGAFLYASAALPIQYSHFFVADSFTTFFVVLTITLAVRVSQGGGWAGCLGMGVACGLALASKVSVALIVPVMAVAAAMAYRARRDRVPIAGLALSLGAAFLAFRVAQPYAFAGTGFLDLRPSLQFLESIETQRRMAEGSVEFPYTLQWAGTIPYLFPFQNFFWGLGPALTAAAVAGAGLALYQLVRERRLEHLLVLLWVALAFLYFGGQMVKYMRYFLPIYPFLALLAAYALVWLVRERGTRNEEQESRVESRESSLEGESGAEGRASLLGQPHGAAPTPEPLTLNPRPSLVPRSLFLVPFAVVLLGTFLWAWAFTGIYGRPVTRVEASRWIYENVPAGAALAVEHWDDPLPLSIKGQSSQQYRHTFLELYNDDNPAKVSTLAGQLAQVDYIILSSNRLYGSIPRLPLRYPMTSEYYRLLFSGDLGFQMVRSFTSYPSLGALEFVDDWADESFTVYDHPKVMIFQKSESFSRERAVQLLSAVPLDSVVRQGLKEAATNGLMMPPDLLRANRTGGTWSEIFDPQGLPSRFPFLSWYLLVQVLSLAALPLGMAALGRLPDRGYPLLKALGILLVAYLSWLAAALRLLPFGQGTLIAALALVAVTSALVLWRRWDSIRQTLRQEWRLMLVVEIVFLAAFLGFYFIRLANPDLWHPYRGGEKPMDLAYLNAVVKSTYFPSYDPWFAGGYINYYYFGQVLVAALTKLTAIPTATTYNLAVPLFFALTVLGAFSAGYNLVGMGKGGSPGDVSPQRRGGRGDDQKAGNLGGLGELGGRMGSASNHESPNHSIARVDLGEPGGPGFGAQGPGEEPGGALTLDPRPLTLEKGSTLDPRPSTLATTGTTFGWALAGGLAAALLVAVAGNLDGLFQLVQGLWKINPQPFESAIPGASGLVNGWLGLGEALGGKTLPVFDFWRGSRLMSPAFSITEFPYFTFLFADLHPHMIALPYTLLALGFVIAQSRESRVESRESRVAGAALGGPKRGGQDQGLGSGSGAQGQDQGSGFRVQGPGEDRGGALTLDPRPSTLETGSTLDSRLSTLDRPSILDRLSTLVLFPMSLGALWVINSWDFPTYFLVAAAVLLLTQARQGFTWAALGRAALLAGGLFLGSYLLYYPFHYYYQQFYLGVGPSPEKTPIHQYLAVHGLFVVIIGSFLLSRLRAGVRRAPGGSLLLSPGSVLVGGVGAFLLLSGLPTAAFLVLMLALALLALAAADGPPSALAAVMVIVALAVGLGVEFITIKGDIQRMNTVFKFYLQAWVLMGAASAYCLVVLLKEWLGKRRPWAGYAWTLLVAVALWGTLLYPLNATPARVADRFIPLPASDDGTAYLAAARYADEKGEADLASDYRAIKWMQENIQGSPVVLEANTPLYHWGSRISIYTGLPTVIGWDWHQKQQRANYHNLVENRLADVRTMYSTTDTAALLRLLRRYDVSYVYVGQTERNYYPASGLAKFEALAGTALRRVYQDGPVSIHEVVR